MKKHTLIITEKPSAAEKIATALDEKEKPLRIEENRVPYFVAERGGEIVIVPSLGHLYTVAAGEGGGSRYPVFDFRWVPRYVVERGAGRIRRWIDTITRLAKNADVFIDACDYDIEGSVIGYNILKFACNGRERYAKRMKYSTLTNEELEYSYANPLPHLDSAFIESGRTRHEVDWLYGINLSRALTSAAKNHSGKYATISTGRVQGPTLKFVVAREKAIKSFVPTPYWNIRAIVKVNGRIFETLYEKERIETRREADAIVQECRGRDGVVEKIDARMFQQSPPMPFDLGSLQAEAYRLFRFAPKRTSAIAQHLYLDALISYPRTSSQKLSPSIDYRRILRGLSGITEYRIPAAALLAKTELRPVEGNNEDPAHPAIHPTGMLPTRYLDSSEKRIWDLITHRFMAAFAGSSIRKRARVSIAVNDNRFQLIGVQIMKRGWMRFYEPYVKKQEYPLPDMREGDGVIINRVILDSRFTNPPPHYNPISLLKKMERAEIGTKATRADIIQTIYDRKYVRNESITPTDLGFEVLDTLEKHCPAVVSTKLTRELEQEMENVHLSKERREKVLARTIEILRPILEKLKENEEVIGEQLSQAIQKSRIEERTLGMCPVCKTGKLVIVYSKKTGKRFVGCTNYFRGLCRTSSPLPQRGSIRLLSKLCPDCDWPVVQIRLGKRTWRLCTNVKHSQKMDGAAS